MAELMVRERPVASQSYGSQNGSGTTEARIYTRFGDEGDTMLLGRVRVRKDSPRVHLYGTIDEATSSLGLARASTASDDICRDILDIQGELIEVMTELATGPGVVAPLLPIGATKVQRLENRIDAYEAVRIATGLFVRPGGSLASASLDLARAIVRRAERLLVALSEGEKINPLLLQYLNRLSDLLYVMARVDEQREIRRVVMNTLQSSKESTRSSERPVLPVQFRLDLQTCNAMMEAGVDAAVAVGVPMVLAAADASGNLIELRRMDGALEVSVNLAPSKAYTAAAIRMPTAELALLAQPGAPLFGIEANMPRVTTVGGGLPLVLDGVTVGAVGVSGGSVEQDVTVARAMVAEFARRTAA